MKNIVLLMFVAMGLFSQSLFASISTCPDPQTSSLQWGEIPAPWELDPFSANQPQAEAGIQFVRANIMVAGLGKGVVCTYKFSLGNFSIWWPVLVKIPAREDYNWINTLGGFVCNQSVAICQFSVAD